jgi:hypothetical protein
MRVKSLSDSNLRALLDSFGARIAGQIMKVDALKNSAG